MTSRDLLLGFLLAGGAVLAGGSVRMLTGAMLLLAGRLNRTRADRVSRRVDHAAQRVLARERHPSGHRTFSQHINDELGGIDVERITDTYRQEQ